MPWILCCGTSLVSVLVCVKGERWHEHSVGTYCLFLFRCFLCYCFSSHIVVMVPSSTDPPALLHKPPLLLVGGTDASPEAQGHFYRSNRSTLWFSQESNR